MSIEQVRFLEELAANAWPAEVAPVVDGWRLRFTWGVTRRMNSVWPNGAGGSLALAEKLELVEDFYGRWRAPARYQICPAAQPADLDMILAGRGYAIDAPTHVQTAAITTVLNHTPVNLAGTITVNETFDARWFTFQRKGSQLSDHAANVRQKALQRIGPRVGYALVETEGEVAGIGLGVYERGWVGIFNMLTHPAYRRRDVASAVLRRLAQWGEAQGATHIYLQVMAVNTPARNLYQRAGFTTLYHYHYREAALLNDSRKH